MSTLAPERKSKATFLMRVWPSKGPVVVKTGLDKVELRKRVDSWFKDDNALTLVIEVEGSEA